MNWVGCEPLKLNDEWWRGEMWTPINWLCSKLLVVNRSCSIYVVYSKNMSGVIFLVHQILEISILFMFIFYQLLTTEVKCLYICIHWNNSVSHIVGRHSVCRLHNLPNQKVLEINYRAQYLSFFSFLSMKTKQRTKKKSEGCNHSIAQSVTFV